MVCARGHECVLNSCLPMHVCILGCTYACVCVCVCVCVNSACLSLFEGIASLLPPSLPSLLP